MANRSRFPFLVCLIALVVCLPGSFALAGDVKATISQLKSGTQAMLMGLYFRNQQLGWAAGAG